MLVSLLQEVILRRRSTVLSLIPRLVFPGPRDTLLIVSASWTACRFSGREEKPLVSPQGRAFLRPRLRLPRAQLLRGLKTFFLLRHSRQSKTSKRVCTASPNGSGSCPQN